MTEMTTIMQCKCDNDFQDERYGDRQRVFVYTLKSDNYRCTVCGNLKQQTVCGNLKQQTVAVKKDTVKKDTEKKGKKNRCTVCGNLKQQTVAVKKDTVKKGKKK
jgi:hypothetical protein